MKTIKAILISVISFVFLPLIVNAEKWNDVYSTYSSVLDKGIECKYTCNSGQSICDNINYFILSANKSSFVVTVSDGYTTTQKEVYGSGSLSTKKEGGIQFVPETVKSIINSYSNLGYCPITLYIKNDASKTLLLNNLDNDFRYTTTDNTNPEQQYEPSSNNDDTQEPTSKCKASIFLNNIIDCEGGIKTPSGETKDFWIEIGRYKENNGVTRKYLTVGNYDRGDVTNLKIGKNNLTVTLDDGSIFTINSDSVDDLFLAEQKFLFLTNWIITANPAGSNNYIISKKVDSTIVEDPTYERTIEEQSCESLFGDPDNCDGNCPAFWMQYILNIMKFIGIAALIVLSSMDFFKAATQDDKDAIKKASSTTIKRIIYCILIFFVPTIVNFLMHLFGAYSTCGLK